MKKKKKLKWNILIKDLSTLALILTITAVLIANYHCTEAKATVEEEPTETAAVMELDCYKHIKDIPLDFKFQTYINDVCKTYEIAPEIVFAMIAKESNYNAQEIGDDGKSYGLMQVQEQWHEDRIDELEVNNLLDPYQNVLVGVDYLAELLTYYDGNIEKALTAYNAGATGAYDNYFRHGISASEYAEEVIENSKIIDEGMVLVFYRTDEPAADFDRYDAEQQKQLEKCPKCSMCDEYIQSDHFYEINDEVICEECINDNFRKNTEDFME